MPKSIQKFIGFAMILLLSIVIAFKFVAVGNRLIERSASTYGGEINVIIAYIAIIVVPFFMIYLFHLSLSTFTAVAVSLFPLITRSANFFSLTGYTSWYGTPVGIGGLALLVPFFMVYAVFRYGFRWEDVGWNLPSIQWYKLLVVSGIFCQFFFTSFYKAIPLAYLVVVPQFLLILLVIASVKTEDDVIKVLWGIIIAVTIGSLLIVTAQQSVQGPLDTFRLNTNAIGTYTSYGEVLASTLCLIPMLIFLESSWIKRIFLGALFIFFVRKLAMTMTRGAYISLLPILGYMFLLNKKDRTSFALIAIAIIVMVVAVFGDELFFYLTAREFYFDSRFFSIGNVYGRGENAYYTLKRLLTEFPNFFVGFGIGTYENFDNPGAQTVHQGLLAVWVNAGLAGLIGFLGCFYHIYSFTFKKWNRLQYPERILIGGIILALSSWVIFLNTTSIDYASGGDISALSFMTIEMGLAISLTQKMNTESVPSR